MSISPEDLLKVAPKGKTAQEFAEEYGIPGKEFRIFLRNVLSVRVGKGKSHSLTVGGKEENEILRKFFSHRGKKNVTDEDLENLRKYVAARKG